MEIVEMNSGEGWQMPDFNSEKGLPVTDLDSVRVEEPEDGVYTAYANVFNIDWTLYDARLRFAEMMFVVDEDNPNWTKQKGIILDRASITMPWHQVKNLRDVLIAVVQSYESVNGELKRINLPPPVGGN